MSLGFAAKYISDRYAENENATLLDRYTRYDASLTVSMRRQLEVALHVKNIFDEQYENGVFNNLAFWVNRGRERSLELVVQYEF